MATLRPQQIATFLVLVTLTACAFFVAQGVTGLAAAKFLALDPNAHGASVARAGGRPVATQRAAKSPLPIIQRNIFELPSEAPPPEAGAVPGGPVVIIEAGHEPPCAPEIRLVGAIVHPTTPELSYAALVQGQTPARLFRKGMPFAGKSVAEIDYDHVLLEDSGSRCKVTMFGTTQAPIATAAVTPPPAPAAGPAQAEGDLSADEIERGITRVSDTSYNVSRGLLDRALLQQGAIFRTARLIPHEENGRVIGMKIYGIRRSSLLGRLGVQNGDTLSSINGFDLQNADAMVEAYTRMRTAPEFSLSIVRRGTPTTIDYHVR